MSDIVLEMGVGLVRARPLLPNAVRITHVPPGSAAIPTDRPWLSQVLLDPPLDTSQDDTLLPELLVREQGSSLVIEMTNGLQVRIDAALAQLADGHVHFQIAIERDEGFYGFGEWFNAFRRDRGRIRLDTKESQAQNQHRQTYSNIPVFFSSRGYGIFLLNSYRSTIRIDRQRQVLEIEADGPPLDYVVLYGPSFRRLISAYTALTGRPPLLPRWALGLWATGYPQESQAVVLARAEEHRRRGIPLDGIILDYHWEQGFHTFRWRASLFPDPDQLIERLRALGVRLGLIFTPFLNHRNHPIQRRLLHLLFRNVAAGEMNSDERAEELYRYAKEHGYLAHDNAWWWLGSGGMIDFSNQAAADWWNQLMRPRYEQGIVLFKNDDGEYLPDDARSALGMDGREYHNSYGFFYGRAIFDGMKQLDNRRPMIYARSVWAGSQRYPALFLGDQHPTFAHLHATMRAGLNMGLLGFAHWTADVFGLDGKTTPETHMRYAQWALLAPVARYFWRPPAIDATRLPWSHGPAAEGNFRAYALLRYRLLPYYHTLGWEAHQSGMPIIRPLLLEFPDDPRFRRLDDQVMLGSSLLLAPVLKKGATRRRIQLPAGVWHDFWGNRSYRGGAAISYDAPLDRLPILVRGGGLLPLGPALQSIPDDHRFDALELHGYPPYPATLTFFDDNGYTRDYEQGGFSRTLLQIDGDEQQLTVRIGAAFGGYASQPLWRNITLVLHRAARPARVQSAEQTIDWSHDPQAQTVTLTVACPIDRETLITLDW